MVKKQQPPQKPKKADRFARIYREFTRVKFAKYKLQYPRMRETELISKIVKEWEAMGEEEKSNVEKKFIQTSGKGFLEDSSSSKKKQSSSKDKDSSPLDSKSKTNKEVKVDKTKSIAKKKLSPHSLSAKALAQKKSPTIQSSSSGKEKKKTSPKVRVMKNKKKSPTSVKSGESKLDHERKASDDLKKSEQNSKSPGKKNTPEKKQTSSSELAIKKAKNKQIAKARAKARNEEYLTFFKYYFDRLRTEHPRWNTHQITTIIKLLWKKRLNKKQTRKNSIKGKGLSGRQLYTRSKSAEGFLKEQIKQMWKALPYENKKYWQIKGQGLPLRSNKNSGKFVRKMLNLGANKSEPQTQEEPATLNWMNSTIN